MDKCNFDDIIVEKANAISRYRKVQRITTLFRFVELFIFLTILSRFSNHFTFSFNLSIDCCLRGIIFETLVSQKFVFFVGNAIVIALFFISARCSSGEKNTDFYDECIAKCRKIEQIRIKNDEIESTRDEKKIHRSKSEVFVKVPAQRRDLRRSMTEKHRRSEKKTAEVGRSCSKMEKEMISSEEFRQTVEAFIARQQRFLKEEEDEFSSAVVSV